MELFWGQLFELYELKVETEKKKSNGLLAAKRKNN